MTGATGSIRLLLIIVVTVVFVVVVEVALMLVVAPRSPSHFGVRPRPGSRGLLQQATVPDYYLVLLVSICRNKLPLYPFVRTSPTLSRPGGICAAPSIWMAQLTRIALLSSLAGTYAKHFCSSIRIRTSRGAVDNEANIGRSVTVVMRCMYTQL